MKYSACLCLFLVCLTGCAPEKGAVASSNTDSRTSKGSIDWNSTEHVIIGTAGPELATKAAEMLRAKGIDAYADGSLAYGISVPRSDVNRAKTLLRCDKSFKDVRLSKG
jgi:hypothetical protein